MALKPTLLGGTMTPLSKVPMRIEGHGDEAHRIETVLVGWSGDNPAIAYHTACGIGGPPERLHSGVGWPPCATCWPGEGRAA